MNFLNTKMFFCTLFLSAVLCGGEALPERKTETEKTSVFVGAKKKSDQKSGKRRRMGGPPPMRHPLMFALEDKREFTDAERARLKKLAEEDPAKFNREMHVRFVRKRKAVAEKLMRLRNEYLNAKDDAARKRAEDGLRAEVILESESRLAFQKRLLTETEKTIRTMQVRLDAMKKSYDARLKSKNSYVEGQLRKMLDPENIPGKLLRDLNRSENEPPRPPPPPSGAGR